ncbi:hypothetical protein AB0B21_12180 [Streptomyces rimosus]|uniref:hypothetical protein n=1 Tax=Streptomyces rimosus TaxID=1927 RepID=UPI000A49085A|nr:hypothetical protein [Streptomyces rimosus]
MDTEAVALLAALRGTVPVVLGSNATTRLSPPWGWRRRSTRWSAAPVSAWPSRTRASSRRPPAGAEPRRCLFVDDSLGNVTAARTVGMAGLHYRNIGQLREAVAPLPG